MNEPINTPYTHTQEDRLAFLTNKINNKEQLTKDEALEFLTLQIILKKND